MAAGINEDFSFLFPSAIGTAFVIRIQFGLFKKAQKLLLGSSLPIRDSGASFLSLSRVQRPFEWT